MVVELHLLEFPLSKTLPLLAPQREYEHPLYTREAGIGAACGFRVQPLSPRPQLFPLGPSALFVLTGDHLTS